MTAPQIPAKAAECIGAYAAGKAAFAARVPAQDNPHAGAPESDTHGRRVACMWMSGWHENMPVWPDHVPED